MQQNDISPILLFLCLRIRRSTQGLLLPIVWHITTNLFVWKISKQSARKVGERKRNVEPTNNSNPIKGKEREWQFVSWN
jgi:hypothetical protein